MFILSCIAAAVPSYILGGINGAIIASKYFYRKDIRRFGSGNPGLTNFYRVFGKYGALMVVAIDVVKTIAPVLIGGWLFLHFFDMQLFGREFAGLCVMLGHCYPIFYGFAGGKGIMAAGAIMIIIDWRIALIAWGVFFITTALTRFVSLGAMLAAASYPIAQLILGFGGAPELVVATLSAVLLIARHQANIKRLIRGEESRFSFHRKK